ncbi:CvpA family protein [Patescibacteria group bacterium]|nr:CvpA family protein [Patescibacteria group bacterium]
MSFFDLILLLLLFGFVWFGFWNGLIRTLGGIIGLVLAVFVAGQWYETVALKLLPFLSDNLSLARLLSFILVFIITQFIIICLLKVVNKIFNLPVLKILNRLTGAIFGLIEGGLILGLVLYFSTKFTLVPNWAEILNSSSIAPTLISFGKILQPLLPQVLKQIQSLI